MATTVISIPKHFVSLLSAGYNCHNYYWHEGSRINLPQSELKELGLDDDLWAHPEVLPRLELAREKLESLGYGIQIKDAWRPLRLYDLIIDRHRNSPNGRPQLISTDHRYHATGLALDVVLLDAPHGKELWLRDDQAHGISSCYYGFYHDRHDAKSQVYRVRQDLLVQTFRASGFDLGGKRECWHFEVQVDNAVRY